MIMTSMTTHTPVTDLLGMNVLEFLKIFKVMCDVLEKRREAREA